MRAVLFIVLAMAVGTYAVPFNPSVTLGVCAFNESKTSASTYALDTAVMTLDGDTWSVAFSIPAHWFDIELISPENCGGTSGLSWTCQLASSPSSPTAECLNNLECTLAGWAPDPNCGLVTTDPANGDVTYTFAPVFLASANMDNEQVRNYNQSRAIAVTFQTTINATVNFESLGPQEVTYFISQAHVTGRNLDARLDVEITTAISWPYHYEIVSGTAGQVEISADRVFTSGPALLTTTTAECSPQRDNTCTQRLRYQIDNTLTDLGTADTCYLDGVYTVNLTQMCRAGVDAANCPIASGATGFVDTITATIKTSSVCIVNIINIAISKDSAIRRDFTSGAGQTAGTGTVQNAFTDGQDIFFHTWFWVPDTTNGNAVSTNQFISSTQYRECYVDGIGGTNQRLMYVDNGAFTAQGAANAADEFSQAAVDRVLKLTASVTLWQVPAGGRLDLSVSCQYYVTISGTDPGNRASRRRLLQVSSTTTQPTSGSTKPFTVTPKPASSSTISVSPTVAAVAVLGVACAVLLVVAVKRSRKNNNRRQSMEMTDKQMAGELNLDRTSSEAALMQPTETAETQV